MKRKIILTFDDDDLNAGQVLSRVGQITAERDALREALIEIERLARLAVTAIARDPEAEFRYLQSLALKALRGEKETA